MIGIAGIEVALPPDSVAMADLVATLDAPDADQARRLGIERVRTAGGVTGHDLAARAAMAALVRAGVRPDELDVLVHVPGRVPGAFMESELTRMQAALGATAALAVSVGELGCASSTSALMVLDALLRGDPARTTGLITMAAISPTAYRYRRPVTVNGDGGVAVVVTSRQPVFALRDIAQATNGDYWDLFTVDYLKTPQAQWRESCRDERQYTQDLALESLRMARELAAGLLSRNGLTWTDVAHLVMQNLSVSSFEFYARSLGRPISPVCAANLAAYGHLGPLDVFLNLRSLERVAGRGDLVLVMNNSPVAAWTVALFEKLT